MITGKVIYGLLQASTSVKAIIGQKVYPIIAPQGAEVPFVTFRTIQRTPSPTKSSLSLLDTYQIEVNFYHNNYSILVDLVEKARTAIDGYKGTIQTVPVQHIIYESGTEGYVEDGNYFYMQENYTMRIQRNEN